MRRKDSGLDKPTDRSNSQSNKYTIKPATPQATRYATYRTNSKGYDVWSDNTGDGSADRVRVHRLVAVAKFGFEEVADNHVHHKNKCTWDNRPENLELMSPGDHMRHHNKIPSEDLLDDLRAGAEVLGRPPKPTDVDLFGEYGSRVYRLRFGTWEQVLEEAGISE